MEGRAVNKRLASLTALAAVLGGYVVVEGLGLFPAGSGGDEATVSAVAPRAAQVKLNPLEGLDPGAFTAIVDQPLFNPSRQPRPAEPPPPPPAVEQPVAEQPPPPPPAPQGPGPDDYKLLGVAVGPDGPVAALRLVASGQVVYLRKGESVDGWRVIDVAERSVAIGTPENPVTFSMFAASDEDADGDDGMGDDGMGDDGMGGDGGMGGAAPAPAQSLPLPVPQPALPQQFTPPPDTGG